MSCKPPATKSPFFQHEIMCKFIALNRGFNYRIKPGISAVSVPWIFTVKLLIEFDFLIVF